jgi:hypothetical protein
MVRSKINPLSVIKELVFFQLQFRSPGLFKKTTKNSHNFLILSNPTLCYKLLAKNILARQTPPGQFFALFSEKQPKIWLKPSGSNLTVWGNHKTPHLL